MSYDPSLTHKHPTAVLITSCVWLGLAFTATLCLHSPISPLPPPTTLESLSLKRCNPLQSPPSPSLPSSLVPCASRATCVHILHALRHSPHGVVWGTQLHMLLGCLELVVTLCCSPPWQEHKRRSYICGSSRWPYDRMVVKRDSTLARREWVCRRKEDETLAN